MPDLIAPVTAYKAVDQTACKDIDRNTRTCEQRTSEFPVTDEWAYLWFRGDFETSDIGAKCECKVYDPSGNLFASFPSPQYSTFGAVDAVVVGVGEIVGWIGVNVAANAAQCCVSSTATSFSFNDSVTNMAPEPTSKPGEWRAEFTLGDKVVISERLMIGEKSPIAILTQPAAPGLPSNMILLIAAAVGSSMVLLALYREMRKRDDRQPTSSMPAPTKYCINCGASIPAYARHCPKCAVSQG